MRVVGVLLGAGWAAATVVACAEGSALDPGPTSSTTGTAPAPLDCGALVDCDGTCVDLDVDPQNCGACGSTCVVPHAGSTCAGGVCGSGTCEPGWADCDADALTGCEHEVTCSEGGACPTACGSTGALSCADPCSPVCASPAEACNAVDDDCDAECDEGAIAGCRVAVHRAYNGTSGHLFTTDLAEATAWGLEVQAFFYLYADATADLRPFFRCPKPSGSVFFTDSNDCELTGAPTSTLGFIAPAPMASEPPTCGAIPLYRIAHAPNGWHFYTTSLAERDSALASGWSDEGVAGYVWAAP